MQLAALPSRSKRRRRCVTARPGCEAVEEQSGYPAGPADTRAVWAALRNVPVPLCVCARARLRVYSRRCSSARIYVSEVSLADAEDAARKPLLTDWGKQRWEKKKGRVNVTLPQPFACAHRSIR